MSFPWQNGWPAAAEHLLAAIVLAVGLVMFLPARAKAQGFLNYPELNTTTLAGKEFNEEFYNQEDATGYIDNNKPKGLHAGNFFISPSAAITTTFDDNIFSTSVNPESDLKTVFTPGVRITSDFPRHAIDMSLSGRIVTYAENSDQNYQDYAAHASGALHFDHAHTISAGFISELQHEEVGNLTSPFNAGEPVPVFHHRASLGLTRDSGRLYGTVSAHVDRWDYQDIRAANGTPLDQDHRDVDSVGGRIQAGYRVSPKFEVLATSGITHYMHAGRPGADFDGTRYDILAGVGFQPSALLKFRLMGGAAVREYDDPTFETTTSSAFLGDVTWRPTRRMSVNAGLSRSISDTLDDQAGTYVATTATAEVGYEIYHNLFGKAGISFASNDYEFSNRSDDVFGASLGLDYHFTDNVKLTAGYLYQRRDSSLDLFDADRNQFTLGGKVQF